MKSIRTTVWDGVATATDHDGNIVKVSTFDCTYEEGHKRAALELCRKMGWSGVLQGGHVMANWRPSGMVWTWADPEWLLDVKAQPSCWLMKGQMEVGCTDRQGRPSYRWAPCWRIVNKDGHDMIQPYERKKSGAKAVIAAMGWRLMGEK